jgi:hypothetical protein
MPVQGKGTAMTRIGQALLIVVIGLTAIGSPLSGVPNRPKIFKIAYVRLLSSDSNAATAFYAKLSAINPRLSRNPYGKVRCV